jgi:hypothetical protein
VRASIRECDGHHEMSDLGAAGEPVHSGSESVAPVWPHQQRMVRADLMEKIMSKSNDSSKLGRTTPTPDLGGAATSTVRLRDDELQEVSGGAASEQWRESLPQNSVMFGWFRW